MSSLADPGFQMTGRIKAFTRVSDHHLDHLRQFHRVARVLMPVNSEKDIKHRIGGSLVAIDEWVIERYARSHQRSLADNLASS